MTINFELLCVSKMSSLKIYISLVMAKLETFLDSRYTPLQRIPLGTLTQELVTSLLHYHVTLTNPFVLSHRGTTAIKFGH